MGLFKKMVVKEEIERDIPKQPEPIQPQPKEVEEATEEKTEDSEKVRLALGQTMFCKNNKTTNFRG